ncbi:MAG: amidohydrolase [Dehalococcoidia bacterium]|nr:MAG: amidohydrolase [Dehalococcoidia bacterium]
MDRDQLKRQILETIDREGEHAIALAQAIGREAELGYQEVRTAQKVQAAFTALQLPFRAGLALTGVKAVLEGAQPGPTVALLGELDGLPIREHPDFCPETGAVHACGHHCQIGSLIAAASGLLAPGVREQLAGRVVFFAVPAEESVEVEWRLSQKAAGRIEFLGGKAELIRLGEFDDIHLAMMVHTSPRAEDGLLVTSETSNGHVIKFVRFLGRSAHAAGSPHRGINALKAAMLALAAIDAQRETFREEDTVRIHPILTRGGDVVNAVPADVRLESFVRGKTVAAIEDATQKFDRAMRAGALALGASVEITTLPGYLPLRQNPDLAALFRENAALVVGPEQVGHRGHIAAGTDMGDLSQILPAIHPSAAGASGTSHGADYQIVDWEQAVLNPAKALALTVLDLLSDGAAKAQEVIARDRPPLTKAEYLAVLRRMDSIQRYTEG